MTTPHAPMTVEQIEEWVEIIRRAGSGDPEVSHGNQDAVYVAVLQTIARRRHSDAAALATAALKIAEIDFPRWYA